MYDVGKEGLFLIFFNILSMFFFIPSSYFTVLKKKKSLCRNIFMLLLFME